MTHRFRNSKVEHIILTLTKAREYYPPEDAPLELGPTRGCEEAIRCLENHCKLLKGSTSKEVLEVFYQEIGLRLIGYVSFFSAVLGVKYFFLKNIYLTPCSKDFAKTHQAPDHFTERWVSGNSRLEHL